MGKTSYNTAAREAVIGFFSANRDRQFTAEQVFCGVKEAFGEGFCGKSTVYRLVSKLCSESVLRRYYGENENTALYQFAGGSSCEHHFHMKCTRCGRVYHLECQKSDSLMEHVLLEHGFRINSGISMLYGECGNCKS